MEIIQNKKSVPVIGNGWYLKVINLNKIREDVKFLLQILWITMD